MSRIKKGCTRGVAPRPALVECGAFRRFGILFLVLIRAIRVIRGRASSLPRSCLLALEGHTFMIVKHLSALLVLGSCTFARGAVPDVPPGDFDRLLEAI